MCSAEREGQKREVRIGLTFAGRVVKSRMGELVRHNGLAAIGATPSGCRSQEWVLEL